MAIGTPTSIGTGTATSTNIGGGGQSVITTSAQVNVGEFIIVGFGRNDFSDELSSVSDSAGNTYSIVAHRGSADPDPPSAYLAVAKCTSQLNAGGTITGQYASSFSSTRLAAAMKVTGLADSPFDKQAVGCTDTAAQAAAWTTAATAALAQADELAVAVAMSLPTGALRTSTPGGSMVELAGHDFGSGLVSLVMQYQILASASAFTASGTWSGVTNWTAVLATFKGATGGTPQNKSLTSATETDAAQALSKSKAWAKTGTLIVGP